MIIAVAVCAVILLFVLKRHRKPLALILAIAVSAMVAMAVSYCYFGMKYSSLQQYVGETVQIRGVVISQKYSNSFSSGYKVRICDLNGEEHNFIAVLDCEYVSDLQPGYEFKLSALGETLGYGGDSAGVLSDMSDGYMLRLVSSTNEDCIITQEDTFDIEIFISSFSRKLSYKLRQTVGGEAGDLASALALGDRSGLSYETARDFRRSGVSHLLALSGLHMAVVMGILDFLLRRFGVSKGIRCAILLVGMSFYLAITGFSVSACRAAIMLAMVYISYFFATQSDPITSLFIAGVVIIASSPAAVLDIGFWLSFTATLGIILGVPIAESFLDGFYVDRDGKRRRALKNPAYKLFVKALRYTVVALGTTFAATAATALIVWLTFGEISLWTPITNIILSPLTGVLLFLSVLFILLGWLPVVSGVLGAAVKSVAGAMLDITAHFSKYNDSIISLEYDFADIIIPLMALALTVLALIYVKRKWICALPIPAAILAFVICFAVYNGAHENELDITYLHNGKNEVIVATSGNDALICDLTDGSYSNIQRALDAAADKCATDVAAFMLTHYHQRHISTAYRLMCSERVAQLWLPYPQDEREYNVMWSIVYYAERCGSEVVVYKAGEQLSVFDMAQLEAERAYIKRSTHPTLTLSIECGDEKMTYVGGSAHESELYEQICLNTSESQYLIFGVHGPIIKTQYSYPLNNSLHQVVFANDDIMSHFKCKAEQTDIFSNAILIGSPQIRSITLTTD